MSSVLVALLNANSFAVLVGRYASCNCLHLDTLIRERDPIAMVDGANIGTVIVSSYDTNTVSLEQRYTTIEHKAVSSVQVRVSIVENVKIKLED